MDGVDPRSIMITTFTEKASRNLKDRSINYKSYLATKYQQVNSIDIFQLRLGTLHSLCNMIMQEFRYSKYKNYRPLDNLDQLLFIYFNCPLVQKTESGFDKKRLTAEEIKFWWDFEFIWADNFRATYYVNNRKIPSKWIRAYALQLLFNRITEDIVDIEKMRKDGGSWPVLANAYLDYNNELENNFRIDFANIQKRFMEFLDHELGRQFLIGNIEDNHDNNNIIRNKKVEKNSSKNYSSNLSKNQENTGNNALAQS